MKPDKLIELCKNKVVWIQTHNFPDPDAISTAFGLQKLLEEYNIDSRICHEGQIDKLSSVKLLTLCGIEMSPYDTIVNEMKPDDMIILVDYFEGEHKEGKEWDGKKYKYNLKFKLLHRNFQP